MRQLADDGHGVSPSFSDRCRRVFSRQADDHRPTSGTSACPTPSHWACFRQTQSPRPHYGSEQVMIELLPAARKWPHSPYSFLSPASILLILVLVAASYRQVGDGLHPCRRFLRGSRGRELRTEDRPDRRGVAVDRLRRHRRRAVRGRNRCRWCRRYRFLGPYSLEITVGIVLIMCFANLRGLRRGRDSLRAADLFICRQWSR